MQRHTTPDKIGPLTRKVLDYEHTMKRLVPAVEAPADWAPLSEFVATDDFERVGTFLVNSMTVFEFDEDGRICHLDVYLQQPRSGR